MQEFVEVVNRSAKQVLLGDIPDLILIPRDYLYRLLARRWHEYRDRGGSMSIVEILNDYDRAVKLWSEIQELQDDRKNNPDDWEEETVQ